MQCITKQLNSDQPIGVDIMKFEANLLIEPNGFSATLAFFSSEMSVVREWTFNQPSEKSIRI